MDYSYVWRPSKSPPKPTFDPFQHIDKIIFNPLAGGVEVVRSGGPKAGHIKGEQLNMDFATVVCTRHVDFLH